MSIKQAIEALELALPFMEEQATIQGYGFYRPANPHNFFPDPESCTEAEIENHRAACEAYDEGKFVPDNSDGWVSPNLHILKAPWGIGSYTDTIPEIQAQCDKARAALTALRSMPAEPVRCPYCDDTGDVHSIDGEWRGTCKCPAGATPHTEAVRMSEAEINHLVDTHVGGPTPSYPLGPEDWINFARAVEQATAARLGVKMGDA